MHSNKQCLLTTHHFRDPSAGASFRQDHHHRRRTSHPKYNDSVTSATSASAASGSSNSNYCATDDSVASSSCGTYPRRPQRVRSKSFSAESSSNDGDNEDASAAANHRLTLLRGRETDEANNQEASAAKIDFLRQVSLFVQFAILKG